MTRLTLMSAVAALAFTPAALAQETPDLTDDPVAVPQAEQDLQENLEPQPDVTEPDIEPVTVDDEPLVTPEPEYAPEDQAQAEAAAMQDEMLADEDSMVRPVDSVLDESARREQLFLAIDANGDDMISREEWANWQSDDGRAIGFEAVDPDGDDTVTEEEFTGEDDDEGEDEDEMTDDPAL